MLRQRKYSQIYRNKILQMPICRDEETKVKFTELKYSRYQYVESKNTN